MFARNFIYPSNRDALKVSSNGYFRGMHQNYCTKEPTVVSEIEIKWITQKNTGKNKLQLISTERQNAAVQQSSLILKS